MFDEIRPSPLTGTEVMIGLLEADGMRHIARADCARSRFEHGMICALSRKSGACGQRDNRAADAQGGLAVEQPGGIKRAGENLCSGLARYVRQG
jgi:hypothetical protein